MLCADGWRANLAACKLVVPSSGLSSDYSYYYDGGSGAQYEDDDDDDDGRPPNCGRRKSVGLSLQWRKEQVFVVHKMLKESSSRNSPAPKVASSLLFSLFFDLVVFSE